MGRWISGRRTNFGLDGAGHGMIRRGLVVAERVAALTLALVQLWLVVQQALHRGLVLGECPTRRSLAETSSKIQTTKFHSVMLWESISAMACLQTESRALRREHRVRYPSSSLSVTPTSHYRR